jgi:hypothetical protein
MSSSRLKNKKFILDEDMLSITPAPIPDLDDTVIVRGPLRRISIQRGGPGSGHFGHEGRPGEVGGSKPSKGDFQFERISYDKNITVDGVPFSDIRRPLEEKHLADRDAGNPYFQWLTILPDWMLEEGEYGAAAVFTDKEEALRFIQEKMRHLDYEIFYYVSDFGVMLEKTQNDPGHVTIPYEDLVLLRELSKKPEHSNIIGLHNHPFGEEWGVNIPPSFSDFNMADNEDQSEWWVIGPTGRYVVTQGEHRYSMPSEYTIGELFKERTLESISEYMPGADPHHLSASATGSREGAEGYTRMQLALIDEIFTTPGYWKMEFVPNE